MRKLPLVRALLLAGMAAVFLPTGECFGAGNVSPETERKLENQQTKVSQMESRIASIDKTVARLEARNKQSQHVLDIGSGGGADSTTEPQFGGRYGVALDIKNNTRMIRELEQEKSSLKMSLPKEKLTLKMLQNKANEEASASSEGGNRQVAPTAQNRQAGPTRQNRSASQDATRSIAQTGSREAGSRAASDAAASTARTASKPPAPVAPPRLPPPPPPVHHPEHVN